MNYYNENDPKAAAWLRELIKEGLIPNGDVDERSIADVRANDLVGYAQCHFFAGIGGWSLALQLANWPRDRQVWTGSCPCQPFSVAGKGKGEKDERHLWPQFDRLIRARKPAVVFGEQVSSTEVVGSQLEAAFVESVQRGDFAKANKLARRLATTKSFHFHPRWVDGIRSDLESQGYTFRPAVLGAHSVNAPHIRQRLYWVAYANEAERNRSLGRSKSEGRAGSSNSSRLGDASSVGLSGIGGSGKEGASESGNAWDTFDLLPCTDGKTRRIESGSFPLVDGVSGRVGVLRGYGNAIVPEVAAQFIQACEEVILTNDKTI